MDADLPAATQHTLLKSQLKIAKQVGAGCDRRVDDGHTFRQPWRTNWRLSLNAVSLAVVHLGIYYYLRVQELRESNAVISQLRYELSEVQKSAAASAEERTRSARAVAAAETGLLKARKAA